DLREERADEILDQDASPIPYFAQLLMLSQLAHPNTIKVLEIADAVALVVAMHFKRKFMRGRPQQVCPALVPLIPSPWHPSYPSGHSLESQLIARALASVVPSATDALEALAKRIATNREIAGVHFRSDSDAGKHIALLVFPYLMDCRTFRDTLAS